jgi:hypothetical protein
VPVPALGECCVEARQGDEEEADAVRDANQARGNGAARRKISSSAAKADPQVPIEQPVENTLKKTRYDEADVSIGSARWTSTI